MTAAFVRRHMQQISDAQVWRGSPLARAHVRICVHIPGWIQSYYGFLRCNSRLGLDQNPLIKGTKPLVKWLISSVLPNLLDHDCRRASVYIINITLQKGPKSNENENLSKQQRSAEARMRVNQSFFYSICVLCHISFLHCGRHCLVCSIFLCIFFLLLLFFACPGML